MTRAPLRDFIVGVFVLAGLMAVAYLSFSIGGLSLRHGNDFVLYANFDELGGLKPRAPVEIAGVKVGQVDSIGLNDDYRARVKLALERDYALPVDTSASIVTAGVLGDRYVSLQVGGEDTNLKPGDELRFTESAVLLERLIGKLVQGAPGEKKE